MIKYFELFWPAYVFGVILIILSGIISHYLEKKEAKLVANKKQLSENERKWKEALLMFPALLLFLFIIVCPLLYICDFSLITLIVIIGIPGALISYLR